MRYSAPRRAGGFTLIELLVVIAIIAILAAILFPVFAKAREKARQTQCINNQKQLATAFQMYAQDFEEYLPDQATWMPAISVYTGNDKLLDCPSKTGNGGTTAPEYMYNARASNRALGDIGYPSAFALTADGDKPADNYLLTGGRRRHMDGFVASFADGHVSWQKADSDILAYPDFAMALSDTSVTGGCKPFSKFGGTAAWRDATQVATLTTGPTARCNAALAFPAKVTSGTGIVGLIFTPGKPICAAQLDGLTIAFWQRQRQNYAGNLVRIRDEGGAGTTLFGVDSYNVGYMVNLAAPNTILGGQMHARIPIGQNRWMHTAYTFQKSTTGNQPATVRTYLNGRLAHTQYRDWGGRVPSGTNVKIYVGHAGEGWNSSGSPYFDLASVYIYFRTMSGEEIKGLMTD